MNRTTSRRKAVRLFTRFSMLAIATALGMNWLVGPAADMVVFPLAPEALLPALSPFTGIASTVAARTLHMAIVLWLPVAFLSIIFGRWFCRNLCPVGLIAELAGRIRSGKTLTGVPRLGPWLLLLSTGSAFAGYPLFLWLDPLSIFSGFLAAWRQPLVLSNILSSAGLILVLTMSVLRPGSWCYRVCPLGFCQEFLGAAGRRFRKLSRSESGKSIRPTPSLNRRHFLAATGGAVAGFICSRTAKRTSEGFTPIRPPGVVEERFSALCARCGNCAKACPENIIVHDPGHTGLLSFMTPVLKISPGYCVEDCNVCGRVCPTGAIATLSLEDKQNVAIGLAEVDHELCVRCMLCVIVCPYSAITTEYVHGQYYPVVDPDACRGCGLCEVICPTEREAIVIRGTRQRMLSPVEMGYPSLDS